jgi:hypothetical protein
VICRQRRGQACFQIVCDVLVKLDTARRLDLRVHSAKDVCHDKPSFPSTLELLVWAVGPGANAVEGDCALDSAVDTLGGDPDDASLIIGEFHQLHASARGCGDRICSRRRGILLMAPCCARTNRRQVNGVVCDSQVGAQYHVESTVVFGAQACNVEISRRRVVVFPGQARREHPSPALQNIKMALSMLSDVFEIARIETTISA